LLLCFGFEGGEVFDESSVFDLFDVSVEFDLFLLVHHVRRSVLFTEKAGGTLVHLLLRHDFQMLLGLLSLGNCTVYHAFVDDVRVCVDDFTCHRDIKRYKDGIDEDDSRSNSQNVEL